MNLLITTVSACAVCTLWGSAYGFSAWRSLSPGHRLLTVFMGWGGVAEAASLITALAGHKNTAIGNLWELSIPLCVIPAIGYLSSGKWFETTQNIAKIGVISWGWWFIAVVGLGGVYRGFHLGLAVLVVILATRISLAYWPIILGLVIGFGCDLPVYAASHLWISQNNPPLWPWIVKALGWLAAYSLLTYALAREVRHGEFRDRLSLHEDP